jgi:hypothetical protein
VGGLAFRADDTHSEGYIFAVTRTGEYALSLCDNASKDCSYLVAPTLSSAINQGLDQTNLLAVVANGDHITVYVNQHQVASVTNNRYSSGKIGVGAISSLTGTQGPTDVAYNDAKVWTQ